MLEIENVSAGYNGRDVIRNISARINENETLCIMGANGCGKTTLIKAIAGIIPSKGKISIDGRLIRTMKRGELAEKIAVMSQFSSVYFSYTVFETVLMGRYVRMKASLLKRPSRHDREYTERCIEAVGLKDISNRPIETLSGGQLQRVHLARTLAQQPSIILLDEPTNHLDLKYQVDIIDYLREWSRKEGHSVIGVLHDINLAMRLADKVLLLKEGKTLGYGKVDQVINKKNLEKAYEMDVVNYMVSSYKRWERMELRHRHGTGTPGTLKLSCGNGQ